MGRSYRHSVPSAGRRFGRRAPRLLYLGIVLVVAVAAFTVLSARREWLRRIGQSRGQAIFELVQDTVPSRPTETPGVVAWLHVELKRYSSHLADPVKARQLSDATDWHDDESLPAFLGGLRAALLLPPPRPAADADEAPRPVGEAELAAVGAAPPAPGPDGAAMRVQRWVELHGRLFAVTRRRALDAGGPGDLPAPPNRFLLFATHHLLAVAGALQQALARRPLPPVPGRRPPRLVRIYAVAEDGTLVSAPLAEDVGGAGGVGGARGAAGAGSVEGTGGAAGAGSAGGAGGGAAKAAIAGFAGAAAPNPAARRAAALAEGRELRKLPELPNFVPNEFVFRFDPAAARPRVYYSGLYLDLGGQGIVATLMVPVRDPAGGGQAVVALDMAFDIDWQDLAARIEPPMSAEVVRLGEPPGAAWQPWSAMAARGPPGAAPDLRAAVGSLAAAEARSGRPVNAFYLYHGTVEGRGAVAALQVTATTWLVTLFPVTRSSFALLPALLLAVLVLLLLAAFDASRRRTERAQDEAERALQEKQNLLNTMQVPLMVVDPNTDEVVYGNQAAANLGIASGTRAADLVSDEPRARDHYARMQSAERGSRRAYGVPLRVPAGDSGEPARYALVRSVAVTAPIEALHADERHRLAVLFLLEPEADLALYSGSLEASTRADERRRLAGLLAHGVDTLARVLAHCLAAEAAPDAAQASFNRWLAAYLERRVLATAWLLEHWDAQPPLPPDCSIEAAQARATIDSFRAIFARVRADPRLRSRLHWDNGVLAAAPPGAAQVLEVRIDWPDSYWFAAPLRGGFGFFLGEVLINAIRHGRPGSVPQLTIQLDPVRRELLFTLDNELPEGAVPAQPTLPPVSAPPTVPTPPIPPAPPSAGAGPHGESYGGWRLLERLAHLCDWTGLRCERRATRFHVEWRVPVSERGDPRAAD